MEELKELFKRTLFEKILKEVDRIQTKGGNAKFYEELEYIKNKCLEGLKA